MRADFPGGRAPRRGDRALPGARVAPGVDRRPDLRRRPRGRHRPRGAHPPRSARRAATPAARQGARRRALAVPTAVHPERERVAAREWARDGRGVRPSRGRQWPTSGGPVHRAHRADPRSGRGRLADRAACRPIVRHRGGRVRRVALAAQPLRHRARSPRRHRHPRDLHDVAHRAGGAARPADAVRARCRPRRRVRRPRRSWRASPGFSSS